MTKMLGRIGRRTFTCDCCDWSRSNKQVRADENRAWRQEAAEDMTPMDRYLATVKRGEDAARQRLAELLRGAQ